MTNTTPTSGAADRAIEGCPELNMGNYDEVDVERLNDWAIRAHDEIDRLHALAAVAGPAAQPAAQHGVAYAELPVPNYPKSGGFPGTFAEAQMRAFADATHALRVEPLAAACCEELDKLSQRNYELRLASHWQALRLLTQKEKDSLGRRAEGMDGNEWDQCVQEKFAQVKGLKVQGSSYEWDWE